MTDFRLSATWLDGETAGDALERTRGLWEMAVGDEVLTQHVSAGAVRSRTRRRCPFIRYVAGSPTTGGVWAMSRVIRVWDIRTMTGDVPMSWRRRIMALSGLMCCWSRMANL